MKFTAILAAVAAATVVSAQGYNSTSHAASSSMATITDSRTLNVPKPSSVAPTAITSIDTITSQCGSVTVLLPGSTHVYPMNGTSSGATRTTSTYSGTQSPVGAAAKTQVAALAGAGALALAAMVL